MLFFISEIREPKLITIEGDKLKNIINSSANIKRALNNKIYEIEGIYSKGGLARGCLLKYISINEGTNFSPTIRDHDIFCTLKRNELPVSNEELRAIDVRYEDIEFGTLNDYFNTRDITLNECLLSREKLIFTRNAYLAAKKQIIQPSKYEVNESSVSGRLYVRMILFATRYNYTIPKQIKHDSIDEFQLFVCLIKAFELGIESDFFVNCYKYGIVEDAENVEEWLVYLYSSIDRTLNINVLLSKMKSTKYKDFLISLHNIKKSENITDATNYINRELNDMDDDTYQRFNKYFEKYNID